VSARGVLGFSVVLFSAFSCETDSKMWSVLLFKIVHHLKGIHENKLRVRNCVFVGLAYQGMDIVFRFIIKYTSLTDLAPRSIFI
jgi:hypothetical protein